MSMFVWADGTVTGSVNVDELENIQKGLKGVGKAKLAGLPWPIESVEQLTDALAGSTDDDTDASKPAKASKPDADMGDALSQVDLPDLLDKAKSITKKEKS